MTIAYWCVLITAIMPYIFTGIAKIKAGRPYNNHNPRAFLAQSTGLSERADNAQHNNFEAFPAFAAAVIIAHQVNVGQMTIDTLAVIFVGARVLYGYCYLSDRASLRTLFWMVGIFSMIGLFVSAGLVS